MLPRQMTRVSLLEKTTAPLRAQRFFASGDPGPLISTFAHVPEMLEPTAGFLGAMFGESAVAMRLKEIVILRASARMACRYCTETHLVKAQDAGLTRDEVISLGSPDSAEHAFTEPREKALVRWTDLISAGSASIPEPEVKQMLEHYTEAEMVEITLLAGATMMLNRYATAFDLPTAPAATERLAEEKLR